MGGLARKATIVDQVKAEGHNPVIVDAGNLFFKTNKASVGLENDINKINTNTIVEAFNTIGCDAFSPGENDFSNNLEYLFKLQEEASFPFVSANLVDPSTKELVFNPYVIVSRKGIKISIIGLSSVFNNSSIQALDPITSLSAMINDVRSESDFVVLLFNANDEDILRLQNSNIDIDLVVRSKSKIKSNDGGKKRLPVYSCGDRGKYIYRLNLKLSQSGLEMTDITSQNNIVANAQKRLDRMKKGDNNINLKEFYKDDQQMLNRILGYERQLELAENKLDNAHNTIELVTYELGKTITDKPEILKIVDAGKEKINLMKGPQYKNHDNRGRAPSHPHHGHNH